MRPEDIEALERGYAAWNRGELDAVFGLVDPEIEWAPGADSPEAGVFTGREGFISFVTSWTESFEDFRLEPEEITAEGDHAIVAVRQSGRGHGSGIELDIGTIHVWEIRDGIAHAWAAYRRKDEAQGAIACETVRRSYEAFNRGDVESALAAFDPEVEWQTYIVPGPGGGVYHGHAGVRELWSDAKRVFGEFRNIPEEMFFTKDKLLVHVRIEGVGAKSGAPVEARIAHLHTFRDGKVVLVRSFGDREEAQRAAGLV
jgi:ketosteroid isomerase-like protein